MLLSDLNDNPISMRRLIGPKSHQVELQFALSLGKMTLDQQIIITGLADKYKAATDRPNEPSYRQSLHKALAGSLLPVLASWEIYEDAAAEAAGTPLPITAETLKSLPGPALMAMGLSVFELIETENPDADDPEAGGVS